MWPAGRTSAVGSPPQGLYLNQAPHFRLSTPFAHHSPRLRKDIRGKAPRPLPLLRLGVGELDSESGKWIFFWFRPLPFSSEGKFRLAKSSNRKPLFTESTKSFVFLRILTKTFHILCKIFFCLHLALTCKGFKEKCTFSF